MALFSAFVRADYVYHIFLSPNAVLRLTSCIYVSPDVAAVAVFNEAAAAEGAFVSEFSSESSSSLAPILITLTTDNCHCIVSSLTHKNQNPVHPLDIQIDARIKGQSHVIIRAKTINKNANSNNCMWKIALTGYLIEGTIINTKEEKEDTENTINEHTNMNKKKKKKNQQIQTQTQPKPEKKSTNEKNNIQQFENHTAIEKQENYPNTQTDSKKEKDAKEKPKTITLTGGIKYQDGKKTGQGEPLKIGDSVSIRYRGLLTDGTQFDSNMPKGQPLRFKLGAGEVIKGMENGIVGMKVGGERTIVIPATQGYGKRGAPPDIPPNATLIFDVQIVSRK